MIFKYKEYSFSIPDNNLKAKSNKKPENIGQRMSMGEWESEEVQLLTKYLNVNDKVIELGACIGFLGVIVNSKIKNKTDHILIEANPNLIPVIEENKKLNRSSFTVEHCLIGDPTINKYVEFSISDFILGSSVYQKSKNTAMVRTKSLSEYSEKYNFLIVDIEGGEYELIRKYQNEIAKFEKILIEFHPFYGFSKEDVEIGLNTLKSLGFKVVEREAHVFMMVKNKSNDSNNSY
jgi:FkbM family methyltransferase